MRNQALRKMLLDETRFKVSTVVSLPELSDVAVQAALQFFVLGTVPQVKVELSELSACADFFLDESLKAHCAQLAVEGSGRGGGGGSSEK
mgnify:CR=1 FL=1